MIAIKRHGWRCAQAFLRQSSHHASARLLSSHATPQISQATEIYTGSKTRLVRSLRVLTMLSTCGSITGAAVPLTFASSLSEVSHTVIAVGVGGITFSVMSTALVHLMFAPYVVRITKPASEELTPESTLHFDTTTLWGTDKAHQVRIGDLVPPPPKRPDVTWAHAKKDTLFTLSANDKSELSDECQRLIDLTSKQPKE
ncbi:hypothetical protein GQ42DRAFT_73593 [Ramicandelaber brevisporus]|nr:hypothetical protein GQ42DRAFT_73593 [Ramicandelaber brevisporus]